MELKKMISMKWPLDEIDKTYEFINNPKNNLKVITEQMAQVDAVIKSRVSLVKTYAENLGVSVNTNAYSDTTDSKIFCEIFGFNIESPRKFFPSTYHKNELTKASFARAILSLHYWHSYFEKIEFFKNGKVKVPEKLKYEFRNYDSDLNYETFKNGDFKFLPDEEALFVINKIRKFTVDVKSWGGFSY